MIWRGEELAVARQELLEPLIGIKPVPRIHGLGYSVGVKQQSFARAENHTSGCIRTLLHKPKGSSAGVFQGSHSAVVKVIG